MFLVSAHTIYVHSSWKHCWRENQLPSFTEDKEVFLHVQDWWLYPVKTHSPTSEAQLPVHTKKTAFFFFKTHKIHSFLNSPLLSSHCWFQEGRWWTCDSTARFSHPCCLFAFRKLTLLPHNRTARFCHPCLFAFFTADSSQRSLQWVFLDSQWTGRQDQIKGSFSTSQARNK